MQRLLKWLMVQINDSWQPLAPFPRLPGKEAAECGLFRVPGCGGLTPLHQGSPQNAAGLGDTRDTLGDTGDTLGDTGDAPLPSPRQMHPRSHASQTCWSFDLGFVGFSPSFDRFSPAAAMVLHYPAKNEGVGGRDSSTTSPLRTTALQKGHTHSLPRCPGCTER